MTAPVKAQVKKFSNRKFNLILAATVALTSSACWAGRPLATEDAGVLGKGQCEFESFAGRQVHSKMSLGSAQVGCGIGLGTQFALGASREVSPDAGMNYVRLNGKTALRDLTEDQAGFALAYTLSSNREKSDYLQYVSAEVKGAMTLPHGNWLLHVNAGLLHIHSGHDERVVWAVAAERLAAIASVDLMGEIYGDNQSSPWVQIAGRWTAIPNRLFFDASYGVQTNGAPSQLVTLGMKVPF